MRLPAILRRPLGTALVALVVTGALEAATRDARHLAMAYRALAGGAPRRAVDLLKERGHEGGETAFLLGTAQLRLGQAAEAVTTLSRAVASAPDPELRRRALHNLSVAHLSLAVGGAGGDDVHARGAAAAAIDALRLRPDDEGARWNLALATRLVSQTAPTTGAGRRDGGRSITLGSRSGAGRSGQDVAPLSQAESLRILDALRSAEGASVSRGAARLLATDPASTTRRGPPW